MSNFSAFFKANKKKIDNQKYAAAKDLIDPATGEPVEWELKAITTKESEKIRAECMGVKIVNGKMISQFDNEKFTSKLICASIVVPDLYDAELQDSYGVKTPEDLIKELVSNPKEYNALMQFIAGFSDISDLQTKVTEAKN